MPRPPNAAHTGSPDGGALAHRPEDHRPLRIIQDDDRPVSPPPPRRPHPSRPVRGGIAAPARLGGLPLPCTGFFAFAWAESPSPADRNGSVDATVRQPVKQGGYRSLRAFRLLSNRLLHLLHLLINRPLQALADILQGGQVRLHPEL